MIPSSPLSVSERSALCDMILKLSPKDLDLAWESEWKRALGARRREDFSVALLPGERELLVLAVRRLFADPDDGPARICLWILRRDYAVPGRHSLPRG